jgi:hypothetical protein
MLVPILSVLVLIGMIRKDFHFIIENHLDTNIDLKKIQIIGCEKQEPISYICNGFIPGKNQNKTTVLSA